VTISIVFITGNEEANIGRTLESVLPLTKDPGGEIIVVDSESTDRTVEIARRLGAKVFVEPWKGFSAQKNSAIDKAVCDWILLLDADESLPVPLVEEIRLAIRAASADVDGFSLPRMNYFFGRWVKHGGYWPDRKQRLFRRGRARVANRLVHEDVEISGRVERLECGLCHDGYPTIESYIENVDWYSTLKAQALLDQGHHGFSVIYIVIAPVLQFLYNYFLRGGFLDGKQGFLVHFFQSVYIALSFAKVWESDRLKETHKRTIEDRIS
jgi:glycosyltransferase involved in cell wall biosynthesis